MREFKSRITAEEIIVNPSVEELRALARSDERTTQYGSASYVSKVRNRSAKNTFVVPNGIALGVSQAPITQEKANQTAEAVLAYLADKRLIQLDKTMGQGDRTYACRLYVTTDYARLAHMWNNMLFPGSPQRDPDFVSLYVPEWPERLIFVDPEAGITFILGTDYFGEAKKSFLRMAMYAAKKEGALGLHAGSKILRIKGDNGILRDVGFIMFGLSGTGKTTLTIHDHGLTGEEKVIIRQDDVVMIQPDGSCLGTENGFFIKTEGLDASQRVLYAAAQRPEAIFENVWVAEDGIIDFSNSQLTGNGRGVILRGHVEGTDAEIDLPKANKVIFITRRQDIIPPVARLTPEQAAAYFMLGESIETSAGDPTKAGQSKREVGTNPFIVGPEAEEGNLFLEILRANPDMECFLLNTGTVGQSETSSGQKVTIKVSTELMKAIARGGIQWTTDPVWGYQVPVSIPGVDLEKYCPESYYSPSEYAARCDKLRDERRRWLAQFPGLAPEVAGLFQ
ncbi:MAG: phosphoenolpyruvate carboxykinase (ATP) [Bacillota bacterium]